MYVGGFPPLFNGQIIRTAAAATAPMRGRVEVLSCRVLMMVHSIHSRGAAVLQVAKLAELWKGGWSYPVEA
jgi:hypothetical protein